MSKYKYINIYVNKREREKYKFSCPVQTSQTQEVLIAQDEVTVARGERAFNLCSN